MHGSQAGGGGQVGRFPHALSSCALRWTTVAESIQRIVKETPVSTRMACHPNTAVLKSISIVLFREHWKHEKGGMQTKWKIFEPSQGRGDAQPFIVRLPLTKFAP